MHNHVPIGIVIINAIPIEHEGIWFSNGREAVIASWVINNNVEFRLLNLINIVNTILINTNCLEEMDFEYNVREESLFDIN